MHQAVIREVFKKQLYLRSKIDVIAARSTKFLSSTKCRRSSLLYLPCQKDFLGPVNSTFCDTNRKLSRFPRQLKSHLCGDVSAEDVGKCVTLRGFLQYQRMGIFCILRDSSGLVQVVVNTDTLSARLKGTPYESYIQVTGKIVLRPKEQKNETMRSGEVEVVAEELLVVNEARRDLPFLIRSQNKPTETLGLKHRYLDLRQSHLQQNLRFRSELGKKMRDLLQDEKGFLEVITPSLSVNTPGGSQEFVVPSRFPSEFYSLAQSPQTFKQMAMVAGLEAYFQFATCYRDEGARPDRQPEFMQLDLEMSDTTAEEVRSLLEEVIVGSWGASEGAPLPPPPSRPFPTMTYEEAMERYGVDKPDTRFEWKLCDVSDLFSEHGSPLLVDGGEERVAKAFVVPGAQGVVKKCDVKHWEDVAVREVGLPGVMVLFLRNGTLKGQGAHLLTGSLKGALAESLQAAEGDCIVLAVGKRSKVLKLLGRVRLLAADAAERAGRDPRSSSEGSPRFCFLWVLDFPLFELDEATGRRLPTHHPFTAPRPDHAHLLTQAPMQVKSEHYDLVLNGCEVAGGSIRIHDAATQRTVFDLLGMDASAFGFLLQALDSGAPPHGGIALGFDRYVAILRGAKSVREVMAFPKTAEGRCLMTGAPASLSDQDRKLYRLEGR